MSEPYIDRGFSYSQLDPSICDVVRKLHAHGFETTDSGDGVSKPKELYDSAIPFPHVVIETNPEMMVTDAEIVARILGPEWNVEAVYQTMTKAAHLFARTMFPEEIR
jgi:hypothetical protein